MHANPTTHEIRAALQDGRQPRSLSTAARVACHHHALKLPLAFVGIALAMASTSFEPGARTRRGRTLEGMWQGLQVCLGLEPSDGGSTWLPRLLLVAAVVVTVAIGVIRRRHREVR